MRHLHEMTTARRFSFQGESGSILVARWRKNTFFLMWENKLSNQEQEEAKKHRKFMWRRIFCTRENCSKYVHMKINKIELELHTHLSFRCDLDLHTWAIIFLHPAKFCKHCLPQIVATEKTAFMGRVWELRQTTTLIFYLKLFSKRS